MRTIFTLLLVIIVSVTKPLLVIAQIANITDSLALVELYKSTNGPNWTNHTEWLTGPVKNWNGIKLDTGGRVTYILFDQNNMKGALPSSLGNLSKLQYLIINVNQLTGSIPSSLGNLSKLKYLALRNNQLTGNIPSSIGNITNLYDLELQNNQLSGSVPASLVNFTSIGYLNLSNNYLDFSGLEALAQKFNLASYTPQLTILKLNLTNSKLSVSAGGTLSNNTYTWYQDGTKIKTVTGDSIFTTSEGGDYSVVVTNSIATKLSLYSDTMAIYTNAYSQDSSALVDLYNSTDGPHWIKNTNWLKGAIKNWAGVTVYKGRVTALDLSGNNLSGYIPATIGNLTQLVNLYLYSNKLTGNIPVEIGNLVNLNRLWLAGNQLSGVIPKQISKLTKLSDLWLSDNGFTGDIPIEIGSLVNLKDLDISNNKLSGIVPQTVGNLINLIYLALYQNQLTGNIPVEIGKLVKLTDLELNKNQLTGNLPTELGNLVNLKYLSLYNNQLTGSIPVELGKLANLTLLNLNNNNLTGAIPLEIGNLVKLTFLDFSGNNLTGGIPSSMGKLVNLGQLYLNNNKLSGNIPAFLGDLSGLVRLKLNVNQLTGKIPTELGKLSVLQALWLYDNILSGSVPASLGNDTNLVQLLLSQNLLSGAVPQTIGKLTKLQYLWLYSNQLSGNIPASLGNDTNLVALLLDNNFLSGIIPQTLGKLTNLQQLRLNYNNFNFDAFEKAPPLVISIGDYTSQRNIPVHFDNKKLSVSAGGTLSNNTYWWYINGGTLAAVVKADSTFSPKSNGKYSVTMGNSVVDKLALFGDIAIVNTSNIIAQAKPNSLVASYEFTNSDGWTHYYNDNKTPLDLNDDTLLLSLKKNGQNIGTIGDGTFNIKQVATKGAGSNKAVKLTSPLITNTSGYWVMNRFWQVTATHEPSASIGVRFYYNDQDLKDINGSYPAHNLTNDKLIFYKAVGGNPDPTTGLAGATKIISIQPGSTASDTTWTYHALTDTTQYAEYSVSSFSGGGGGGTGNNQSLPVTLLNFTGSRVKTDVQLNWQTTQEINAGNYFVERSLNGFDFARIGSIPAAGNSSIKQSYRYLDYNAASLNANTLYYRLKITDKDSSYSYSKIISLQIDGVNKTLVLYPNPAHTSAILQFAAAAAKKYTINITTTDGKVVKRINIAASAGSNRVAIDVNNLPQATYMITITGDNDSKTLKLVKE